MIVDGRFQIGNAFVFGPDDFFATTPQPMNINAAWHKKHPMPKPATLAQRVEWHLAHTKACGCREMPKSVVEALKKMKRRTDRTSW